MLSKSDKQYIFHIFFRSIEVSECWSWKISKDF